MLAASLCNNDAMACFGHRATDVNQSTCRYRLLKQRLLRDEMVDRDAINFACHLPPSSSLLIIMLLIKWTGHFKKACVILRHNDVSIPGHVVGGHLISQGTRNRFQEPNFLNETSLNETFKRPDVWRRRLTLNLGINLLMHRMVK